MSLLKRQKNSGRYFDCNGPKSYQFNDSEGDIFGVIGFSGAGKSTLIRTVNLLEEPTSGRVLVNGKELTTLTKSSFERRRKIGMIFQHFNLLHSKTVFENVAMPLIISGVKNRIWKVKLKRL